MSTFVSTLLQKVLDGGQITDAEAYKLGEEADTEAILQAAAKITSHFVPPVFQPCSIINARSGGCSENCKWCAQSAHFHTAAEHYPLLPTAKIVEQARYNAGKGVKRFSLVTSGKAVRGKELEKICASAKTVKSEASIDVCCSLGLLDEPSLQQLQKAGVTRYHCNLETAPSYFLELCTTHTIDDKIATLNAAKKAGLDVCSGGIIGMGESRKQRIELALTLREIGPVSVPINILNPIPGTPLESVELISDEEILLTVALFRFIMPRTELRFAGGRRRIARDTQLKAMKIGVNSAIVGDLLTTVGSQIDADMDMAQEAGYSL